MDTQDLQHDEHRDGGDGSAADDKLAQARRRIAELESELDAANRREQEANEELEEKQQVVTALTERLEQVAEQLDRARRNGGEGNRSRAGDAEAAERDESLRSDLGTLLEQWEAAQPSEALTRIEERLGWMSDILSSLSRGGSTLPLREGSSSTAATQKSPGSEASWESVKKKLLEAMPESAGDEEPVSLPEVTPVKVPEPSPLDRSEQDPDVLWAAIDERDNHLRYLTDRLTVTQRQIADSINWEELSHQPDDLREKLTDLCSQLEEQLRLQELVLSTERARLAREQALLDHRRMQQPAPRQVKPEEPAGQGTRAEQRWKRMLGQSHSE